MRTEVTVILEDGTFRRRLMNRDPNDEEVARWIGTPYELMHPSKHGVLFGTVYVRPPSVAFGQHRNEKAEQCIATKNPIYGRVLVTRPAPTQA